MAKGFLPVSRADMEEQNIETLDFVYVTGDAYVDHPSFGTAIISRVLTAHGYSVGILSQPDWRDERSIAALGRPRLGFLVSAGNMDSMVNHYYVSGKRRPKDAYTPGGVCGKRPDYAAVVYGNLIRRVFKDVPIILGGIEASLRRLAHYDYWSGKLKRSVLLDAGADLLSYGMGERSIVEIAEALDSGIPVRDITFIRGTVYKCKDPDSVYNAICLPAYEELTADSARYARSFRTQYENTDPFHGRPLVEPYGEHLFVVQNSPSPPLSTQEMDDIYDYPYTRRAHPSYEGEVPALSEVRFSITSSRGCFGGCSFCALTFHQGRIVQSRSHDSILREASGFLGMEDFKGYIHDVGGPTANFRHPACPEQLKRGVCRDRQCLFPTPCKNLRVDHRDYLALLRKLRALPGVKKVFIRSGVRFDYLLADKDDSFFRELVRYHISGQLKVAPEHISGPVLERMGKPSREVYERFCKKYTALNESEGKKQYLVPYLMSSHPGSTLKEAAELAVFLKDNGAWVPEQVQDFYPTPSTLSTVMYYTGLDPRTMERVYTPRAPHEKAMQRALLQYRNPSSQNLAREALMRAGRQDLIGYGKNCLIRPERPDRPPGKNGDGRKPGTDRKKSGDGRKKKKTIRNIHPKINK